MSNSDGSATTEWRKRMAQILPYLGHRNWIAVVDSAYPLQTGSGVDTLWTDEEMIPALEYVCAQIEGQRHIAPMVFVDEELDRLEESDAVGITAYRHQLDTILGQGSRIPEAHEEIIAMLSDASACFKVLILKTRAVLPYTSVFLRLECGYWDEKRENRLRSHMPRR